ncbi:MAG TPA: 50S ribosomal protein L24 [Bacteroidia bacterium]|nr:50S ribosomal protein L24 [Bacteroidia bacterium]
MTTKNKRIKLKLKVGDFVRVMRGSSKGKEGKIIFIDTKKQRAIVEGANIVKKHEKPNAKNPQGGIVEKEAPIHISNLMIIVDGKPSRIGRRLNSETQKIERYAKKTNETIK